MLELLSQMDGFSSTEVCLLCLCLSSSLLSLSSSFIFAFVFCRCLCLSLSFSCDWRASKLLLPQIGPTFLTLLYSAPGASIERLSSLTRRFDRPFTFSFPRVHYHFYYFLLLWLDFLLVYYYWSKFSYCLSFLILDWGLCLFRKSFPLRAGICSCRNYAHPLPQNDGGSGRRQLRRVGPVYRGFQRCTNESSLRWIW